MVDEFEADIAAIASLPAVPMILEVICRSTGMGFAAVARVTSDRWIACSVRDEIAFGLKPGSELKIETTICNEIRDSHQAVIINHVAEDATYSTHHTPAIYGFQSYISMPIILKSGVFFGTLCAIDPRPARLDGPEIVGMFRLFAGLIAGHLDVNSQLEQRTRQLDRAWNNSRDLQVVVNTKGVFLAASTAWSTILGWAPEEVVGRSHLYFNHPDHRPASEEALAEAASRDLIAYETRCLHKDGGYRWISWVAAPEGELIYASGRNITAEKAAAEMLAEAQARLRTLFETSYQLQGLVALDGTLLDANSTALTAIGATLEAVKGKPFWETPWFTGTPGLPEFVQAAVMAASGGETVRREVTVNLPSGTRAYDLSMRPIHDAAGAVVAIVPEAVDITKRRDTEEALRQAQKMEAVGQLTGGIAHDFNNLLTGITGSLELLQTRLAQGRTGELDRYVNAAHGAARRAASLTQRLLAFSRRQTLDPKPTNINRLIANLEDLIRRTVGPGAQIEVAGAAGLWTTLVDPNQLESALLNLCINARDAMPDGGRITIETANTWLDDRTARTRELPSGQYVCLCVTDTGTGMTPEVIARAFDPFFTTKPIGQGTGLGLSMIYGFMRQSGGQVRIYSEVGQGASVRLYLPRHYGELEEVEHLTPSKVEASGDGETVLVVDDEPMVRMLITELLDDAGYTTIEAGEGSEALRVLQTKARIDLLITDVGLPGGMNGRQVADAGRALRPDLKVLFITGYAENAVIGNGHLDPGMQILTKPFAMEALASKIGEMIGR
ncbi:PAS domain S-box protein [Caulobacter sp. S45]|uniref:PAS domain S-box protein n=1 Tax=Caulobacter sp. S45 TaxID=1641861 RepID=UPI001C2053DF|nr:PAS domain S-box protein [Caulobacter sp. S45]